jgi:ribosomal protein L37AE/L43A
MPEEKTIKSVRVDIYRWTDRTKARFDSIRANVANAIADEGKAVRYKQYLCPMCAYIDIRGLAGQAFTNWKCDICSQEFTYHTTAVPHVCEKCAETWHVCTKCGADIDLELHLPTDEVKPTKSVKFQRILELWRAAEEGDQRAVEELSKLLETVDLRKRGKKK